MADQTQILITTQLHDDVSHIEPYVKGLKAARLGSVTLVASSPDIAAAAKNSGANVVEVEPATSKDFFAELYKVAQAAGEGKAPADALIVIPATILKDLNPEDLRATRTIFWHEWARIVVFGKPIFEEADKNNTMFVKVVAGHNRRVLYMSRGATPYGADVMVADTGVRAYRFSALRELAEIEPSPLERTEKIPMLRAIENGIDAYMSLLPSSV